MPHESRKSDHSPWNHEPDRLVHESLNLASEASRRGGQKTECERRRAEVWRKQVRRTLRICFPLPSHAERWWMGSITRARKEGGESLSLGMFPPPRSRRRGAREQWPLTGETNDERALTLISTVLRLALASASSEGHHRPSAVMTTDAWTLVRTGTLELDVHSDDEKERAREGERERERRREGEKERRREMMVGRSNRPRPGPPPSTNPVPSPRGGNGNGNENEDVETVSARTALIT